MGPLHTGFSSRAKGVEWAQTLTLPTSGRLARARIHQVFGVRK
jgi:hypothetical protein